MAKSQGPVQRRRGLERGGPTRGAKRLSCSRTRRLGCPLVLKVIRGHRGVLREGPRDLICVLKDHFPGLWGHVDGGPARPFGGLERRRAWGQGSHVDGEDKCWSPVPRRPSDPAPQRGCGLEGRPAQAPAVGTAATGLCEDVLGLLACSSVRKLRHHPLETSGLSVGASQQGL